MRTRKVIFSLAIILFYQAVQGQESNDSIMPDSRFDFIKDSLSLRKLTLETKNLEQESRYFTVTKPLTLIGSFFGLIAIVWTVFSGLKTIKLQAQEQKQNRIAGLLTLLNEDKAEKRASGANGLTRYPKDVYIEILAALKIEQVDYVREMLEDILFKLPDHEFEEVIKANRSTILSRTRLLGSFGATGEKIEITEALLGIYPETRIQIASNFRYFYDQGEETARYQLYRASQLGNLPDEIKAGMITEAIQIARLAYSTSRIIAKRLTQNYKTKDLSILDLNLANLYRLQLPDTDFSRSILTNSICRHSDFQSSNLCEANFNNADLFDCNLSKSTIRNSTFSKASLRDARASYVHVENSIFFESVLSAADFSHADFSNVNLKKARMNGSQFLHAKIDHCEFNLSALEGANFTSATIENSSFYKCQLRAANFSGCNLKRVNFNGADLRGVAFNNCQLDNVDFSGADLKNIRTNSWMPNNCNFKEVKNYDPQTVSSN